MGGNERRWGPQTQYRLMRSCAIWLTLIAGGGLIAGIASSPTWCAFGLGMIFPGVGFLAGGLDLLSVVFALLGFGAFAMSVIAWFATGAVIAPPLVWLGLAVIAGASADAPQSSSLTTILPLMTASCAIGFMAIIARNRADAKTPATEPHVRTQPSSYQSVSIGEMARLRFILDRGLQPVDQFEGFQWVDQFQPAGMRYQLNFAGYALALTQARLPAFRGYLHEAQRRLIEKQRDWRVWRYWRLEEAWGNLRLNADPIIRDNIMYSGFVGAQIALFQATTGDEHFNQPGALTLQTPRGQKFAHDFKTITDALLNGWSKAPYGLMPCEPNWVYPMCNAIGASAVIARDAQNGETRWAEFEDQFREGMETELTTPTGRFVAFRSTLTGLAPPAIGGAAADATPALFYNSSFPDIAERVWSIGRREMLTLEGEANRKHFWRIDTGDYRFSRAASCTSVAAAAAELGDAEVFRVSLDLLDQDCPAVTEAGVTHRKNASVFAHFVEVMARQGGTDALRTLIHKGAYEPEGPVLDVMDYPNTLVSQAIWKAGVLHTVLMPGSEAGIREIPISNLSPNSSVVIEGAITTTAKADSEGRLTLSVPLDGPTPLIVRQV